MQGHNSGPSLALVGSWPPGRELGNAAACELHIAKIASHLARAQSRTPENPLELNKFFSHSGEIASASLPWRSPYVKNMVHTRSVWPLHLNYFHWKMQTHIGPGPYEQDGKKTN